jgi:hypothetical protein
VTIGMQGHRNDDGKNEKEIIWSYKKIWAFYVLLHGENCIKIPA